MPTIKNKGELFSSIGGSTGLISQIPGVPIDPEQILRVSMITRRKQPLKLEALGGGVLSRVEFDSKYAGDPGNFASLREFVSSQGLSIDEASSSLARRALAVFGRAAAMEKAFGVRLLSYKAADGLTIVHVPEGTVHVPGRYAPMIETILALDSRAVAKAHV